MEMMGHDITFSFQFGHLRDTVTVAASSLNLKSFKDMACNFINSKIPNHGLAHLPDRLLLFRHDYESQNILQLLNAVSDVTDETLIEIILNSSPNLYANNHEDIPTFRPHVLAVHSFKAPTFCDYCGEMLFGLVRQGLKCENCALNFHKRCVGKVPQNCSKADPAKSRRTASLEPAQSSFIYSSSSLATDGESSSIGTDMRPLLEHSGLSRPGTCPSIHDNVVELTAPKEQLKIPHTFMVHTYALPTVCQFCKKLLKGLFKQGVQCKDCQYNAHKKCIEQIPQNCCGDYEAENTSKISSRSNSKEEFRSDNNAKNETARNKADFENDSSTFRGPDVNDSIDVKLETDLKFSGNIPLMRIVQSVKQTKRRSGQIIKEGWLVHFTNKDSSVRRHYWRIDSKAITLYNSDHGSNYFKEIPLTDILAIDSSMLSGPYCFQIRTTNVDFFVGQYTPSNTSNDTQVMASVNGVGAHLAKSWETTIRQAMMPIINNRPPSDHEENVPDISKLYQIHADEVLGSGQFGIVYGGVHKQSQREVAIKVIDKLRFPTKQEAQLKNEVAILQNIYHFGVVNLERMFENTEKIYVIMEKLKGDMLEMILSSKNGKLDERVTKFLVTQILVALKHLHSKNIVHCDLKPENVLLSSDAAFPQIKLCDFGFARIIGEKSFRRSVVGTPAYLAPEVLRNKGYNRSLDMWSVGVIIYVSLSGTFPFNEDEDINEQIQNAAFMYPPAPWKNISSDAIDLINNLLQVKQRKRYTVDKSLLHPWLQDRQTWNDLRLLEEHVGARYLTLEIGDVDSGLITS